MRLIEFGGISYRLRNANYADVYISPDLLRFKRNDFVAAREIVSVGYMAARERLGEWLASAPDASMPPPVKTSAPAIGA